MLMQQLQLNEIPMCITEQHFQKSRNARNNKTFGPHEIPSN